MSIVEVDLSKVAGGIVSRLPTKGDIKKIKQALGVAARNEWIAVAGEDLKSSSRDYIDNIQQPEDMGGSVSVRLTGVVPNMVEQGWAPHDLRATVLRSPKAKKSKAGFKYLSVPFRHGTPGTTGRNVGRQMPKAIHTRAKRLDPTIQIGPAVIKGERLHPGMKMGKKAKDILTKKERPWHSASVYLGMIRKAEIDLANVSEGKTKTTGYTTFRTISENVFGYVDSGGARRTRSSAGDSQHWMHPGIKARRIIGKVQKFVSEQASSIIQDAIR